MLQEIVRNNDLLKQFQPAFPVPIENDAGSDQGNDDDDDDDDDDGDEENEENEHDDEMDDDNPTSSDETPLDLSMKCDSNHHEMEPVSMRLSNSKQHPSSSSTKHVKTALAPLREQDTSKYRYVNTAELVQTVKDIFAKTNLARGNNKLD